MTMKDALEKMVILMKERCDGRIDDGV